MPLLNISKYEIIILVEIAIHPFVPDQPNALNFLNPIFFKITKAVVSAAATRH